ncbi:MAG: hypothetical protein KDD35_00115 [Bdellovibrionales bacterium]|nr:hypothetical protein [Bdellovibrionales bacterium]
MRLMSLKIGDFSPRLILGLLGLSSSLCFLPILSFSEPLRISSQFFDRSQVGRVYIRPGLSSILQFPCDIEEAKLGMKSSLEVEISKTLKSELILSAKSGLVDPTNLIVRCTHGNFVFDVIPNPELHQDIIKILGAVGSPLFRETLSPSPQSSRSLNFKKIKKSAQLIEKKNQEAFVSPSLSSKILSRKLLRSSDVFHHKNSINFKKKEVLK